MNVFYFIAEAKPEKSSISFKQPLPVIADSACSTSTTSRKYPKSVKLNSKKLKNDNDIVPKTQANGDDDSQFQEALRMSLEQSVIDENRRITEEEELRRAINASIMVIDSDSSLNEVDNSLVDLNSTNNDSSVFIEEPPSTSNLGLSGKCLPKIKENIVISDANCDTSTSMQNDITDQISSTKQCVKRPKNKTLLEDSSSDQSDNQVSSSKMNKRSKLSLSDCHFQNVTFRKKSVKSAIQYESDDSTDYNSALDGESSLDIGNNSSVMLVEQAENNDLQDATSLTEDERKMNIEFKKAETLFRRVLKRRMPENSIPSISSIDIIRSHPLETAYSMQKEAFEMNNISTNEIYVYHKCEISIDDKEQVVHYNLKAENASGFTFGRGIYFSEYPDLKIGLSVSGLLLCKVMPGKEYLDQSYRLIPEHYNSKRVLASAGSEEILIVENSSQILPCYFIHLDNRALSTGGSSNMKYNYHVNIPMDTRTRALEDETKIPRTVTINAANIPANTVVPETIPEEQEPVCGSTTTNIPNQMRSTNNSTAYILNNEQVAKRMRNMFETSLKLQETGELMMPAEAITTQLYKHQMYALAWMSNRENSIRTPAGILADDMGLGKTLTVISLIISNFHDKRPLAKPDCTGTYSRAANRSNSVLRYMPGLQSNFKRLPGTTKQKHITQDSQVGAKLHNNGLRKTIMNNSSGHLIPGRRKDNIQKVKSSRNIGGQYKKGYSSLTSSSISAFDSLPSPETSDEEGEKDEFDSMCFSSSSSLAERLLGSGDKSNMNLLAKPERHFYDGLSDDEEYQNMTEKERNELLKPKFTKTTDKCTNEVNTDLNLDGMPNEILSSSEDEDFVSTTTRLSNKYRNRISSDEDGDEINKVSLSKRISKHNSYEDFNDLPDVDDGFNAKRKTTPTKILENKRDNLIKSVKNRKSISTLGEFVFNLLRRLLHYAGITLFCAAS